jgi:uncharacterized repeat protein (TIGR03803 family)
MTVRRKSSRLFAFFRLASAVAIGLLASFGVARAQASFEVVHAFGDGTDGRYPDGRLVQATDGNLYGTTAFGGSTSFGNGTVFRMAPDGTVAVLHSFGVDGVEPSALIQAIDGNFYGTTYDSGADGGTIVAITPDGVVTIMHSFVADYLYLALIQASDGNFYGATFYGEVFRMTPDGTVTNLHYGFQPTFPLIQATDGNFCGTDSGSGLGTVFRMTPDGTVTVLYAFTGGADGAGPSVLMQATDGNFYGTTSYRGGGSGCFGAGCGTVFQMTPDGTVTTLYVFAGETDGAVPVSMMQAADGTFYGTTAQGGGPGCFSQGCGTVFQMTPDGAITILHAFTGGTDGATPTGLIQASDGGFYGTTYDGGTFGVGVVFRLSVTPH